MHKPVVAVRKLHFTAGPESIDFHACAEHAPLLERPWPLSLFFSTENHPTRPVDPDDGEEWGPFDCYFCREG
jgi:hypothetical protein